MPGGLGQFEAVTMEWSQTGASHMAQGEEGQFARKAGPARRVAAR